MPLELIIARWTALMWVIFGLSHLLHARLWVALLYPFKEKPEGGFVLALLGLPFGLIMILGHNIWVWDIPVIVTIAGWVTTLKSVIYLLFPTTHRRVMSANARPEIGFQIVGVVFILLGLVVGYDVFLRR